MEAFEACRWLIDTLKEALTTAEITALLQSPPEWLVAERSTMARVRAEEKRAKEARRAKD